MIRKKQLEMTDRYWFAGQAMSGLIARLPTNHLNMPDPARIARMCFFYADAMIAEGEGKAPAILEDDDD